MEAGQTGLIKVNALNPVGVEWLTSSANVTIQYGLVMGIFVREIILNKWGAMNRYAQVINLLQLCLLLNCGQSNCHKKQRYLNKISNLKITNLYTK